MQVIKIKAPVNLNSGLQTPINTILIISEGYLDIKNKNNSLIPSQIATLLYLDAAAILDSREPITGVEDFQPLFKSEITTTSYENEIAETIFIEAVYDQLIPIYTAAKLEIITI